MCGLLAFPTIVDYSLYLHLHPFEFRPYHLFLSAGMVKYAQLEGITGRTMVAITSGANMDFDR